MIGVESGGQGRKGLRQRQHEANEEEQQSVLVPFVLTQLLMMIWHLKIWSQTERVPTSRRCLIVTSLLDHVSMTSMSLKLLSKKSIYCWDSTNTSLENLQITIEAKAHQSIKRKSWNRLKFHDHVMNHSKSKSI